MIKLGTVEQGLAAVAGNTRAEIFESLWPEAPAGLPCRD